MRLNDKKRCLHTYVVDMQRRNQLLFKLMALQSQSEMKQKCGFIPEIQIVF